MSQNETRTALEYWNRLRGKRSWPAREELKLREMAGFLSNMSLVKVIDDGSDFEHRIVGDTVVRAFSVPLQNRRFSEITSDAPALIQSSFVLFRKVLHDRCPLAWRQQVVHSEIQIVTSSAEVILLPLGGEAIDHIAAFGCYTCDPL